MKTQNDINKQFSVNNNATFGHFVMLIGSFIAILYIYVNVLMAENPKSILFVSIAVLTQIVLGFLACLSANFGYGRRRDHIVASKSDQSDLYPIICGDGTDKGFFTFMVGAYPLFFWLFFISTIVVSVISVYIVIDLFKCCICVTAPIVIVGFISFLVAFLYYCLCFVKYIKTKEKAKSFIPQQSSKTSNNNININVMVN